jgi:hypothetical protein
MGERLFNFYKPSFHQRRQAGAEETIAHGVGTIANSHGRAHHIPGWHPVGTTGFQQRVIVKLAPYTDHPTMLQATDRLAKITNARELLCPSRAVCITHVFTGLKKLCKLPWRMHGDKGTHANRWHLHQRHIPWPRHKLTAGHGLKDLVTQVIAQP